MLRLTPIFKIGIIALSLYAQNVRAKTVEATTLFQLSSPVYRISTHLEANQFAKLSPKYTPVLQEGCGSDCQPPLWNLASLCPGNDWYDKNAASPVWNRVKDQLTAAGVSVTDEIYTKAKTVAEAVEEEWKELSDREIAARNNVCQREKIPELFTVDDYLTQPIPYLTTAPAVVVAWAFVVVLVLSLILRYSNMSKKYLLSLLVIFGFVGFLLAYWFVPGNEKIEDSLEYMKAVFYRNADNTLEFYALAVFGFGLVLVGLAVPKHWGNTLMGVSNRVYPFEQVPLKEDSMYNNPEMGIWRPQNIRTMLSGLENLTPEMTPETDSNGQKYMHMQLLYVAGHDITWFGIFVFFFIYLSGWHEPLPIAQTNGAAIFSILLVSASVSCCAARTIDPILRTYKNMTDSDRKNNMPSVWLVAVLPFLLAVLISVTNLVMLFSLSAKWFYKSIAIALLVFTTVEFLYVSVGLASYSEPWFHFKTWNRYNIFRLISVVVFILVISFYPFGVSTGDDEMQMEQLMVDSLGAQLSPVTFNKAVDLVESKTRRWTRGEQIELTSTEKTEWCSLAKFSFGSHNCRGINIVKKS